MPEPTQRGTASGTAVKGGRDRTEQVAVRLPTGLLERLDDYLETLRADLPNLSIRLIRSFRSPSWATISTLDQR